MPGHPTGHRSQPSRRRAGSAADQRAALDRLIAEGRVSRSVRRGLPEPLELTGDSYALSRALDEIRSQG